MQSMINRCLFLLLVYLLLSVYEIQNLDRYSHQIKSQPCLKLVLVHRQSSLTATSTNALWGLVEIIAITKTTIQITR